MEDAAEPSKSTVRVRTAWHPLLVLMLRHLLPRAGFDVTGEFSLTREPLRLDVVIVRKLAEARPLGLLLPSLFEQIRPHLLISFKGPTDRLTAEDAAMLWAYVGLYLVHAGVSDLSSVALRVIAPDAPPVFMERLQGLGGSLVYRSAGMWEGHLGRFPLRLIETQRAFEHEDEHLWHAFAPALLEKKRPGEMSALERELYLLLYQQVEQMRKEGNPMMLKDLDLATVSYDEVMAHFLEELPLDRRLALLTVEQRLAGLAPEQRLAGLAPEQRLAGLAPEQVLLALPDDLLRMLPEEALATLSPEARETVKRRLGR